MKKKALLIEDEEIIRGYVRVILEKNGYKVVEAETGGKGLERFSEGGFTLVVTDMVLPEHGGGEIVQAVRKADPAVTVVAISGAMSYPELLAGAGRNGADAVVQKPFTENELLNAIRQSR
jgi:DNA-binding response OmpR family regulator